jgi:hypothetical protein
MKNLAGSVLALCLLSQACTAQSVKGEQYSAILKDRYPDFEVVGPEGIPTEPRGRHLRYSPESFYNDILMGDFNFDGVEDFAAALLKVLPADEPHSRFYRPGITVVCNGQKSTDQGSNFKCAVLNNEFAYEYLDLERIRANDSEYVDPICAPLFNSHKEQTVLAVPQHYGTCDTFYFATSDTDDVAYLSCSLCSE